MIPEVKLSQIGLSIKKKMTTELTLLIGYFILCTFFSFMSPYFFSLNNFLNIGLYGSIVGIAGIGMTMVLLTGNIDVSVGALMGLIGVSVASFIEMGVPFAASIILGISIGIACGLLNGLIITRMRINALIATLSTMAIFRGLAFVLCGGLSKIITSDGYRWYGRGYILGVPVCVWIMVIFYGIFIYILRNTKFGRRVYAIGGNSKASYLSGVNVKNTVISVFTLAGLTAGIGGILMAAQTGSGLPSAGQGMEMEVIAAAVLGGTSLSGGKGNLVGTLIGVMMMATLGNGMVLMNVPAFYQQIAKGVVLLIAVFMDSLRSRDLDEA